MRNEEAQLAQANFSAKETDSNKYSEIYSLAKEKDLPVDFVERNYEALRKTKPEEDYSDIPKTMRFMSDVTNNKLAKDDLESLREFEKSLETHWYSGDVARSLGVAGLNAAKSVSQIPALGYKAIQSQNIYGAAFLDKEVPEVLYKNPVTEYLQSSIDELTPEDQKKAVFESAMKGDLKPLALNVITNLPQVALTMINPSFGLSFMGATSASSKFAENLEKGIDSDTAAVSAVANAGLETGIEMLGGIGSAPMKEVIQSATKSLGKQSVVKAIKDGFMVVGKNAGVEGFEEAATTIGQSVVDWALDVDQDALNNLPSKVADSFLVGAGAGGATVGTAKILEAGIYNIPKQTENFKKEFAARQSNSFYTGMKESILKSKLFQRTPEKMQEFVQKQVENTAVETTYIDSQKFDEYFQTKGLDPIQIVKDLGIEQEYNLAKETESDLKVPTSKWVTKLANTEHYDALANDVRLQEDGFSINELKQEKKDQAEVQKTLQDIAEDKIDYDEESKQVIADVKQQLIDSGVDEKTANMQSKVYRFVAVQAEKLGVSPKSLYDRFGLKIISGEKRKNDLAPLPEELLTPVLQLSKNDDGSYNYDKDVLNRMLSQMNQGKAGFRSKEGAVPSTFPSWFKDKGYKSKDVKNVIRKKMLGEALSEKQSELLNLIYESAIENEARGVLYQQDRNAEQKIEYKSNYISNALKEAGAKVSINKASTGTVYIEASVGEDIEDFKEIKIRVGDHDPSNKREAEFGASDILVGADKFSGMENLLGGYISEAAATMDAFERLGLKPTESVRNQYNKELDQAEKIRKDESLKMKIASQQREQSVVDFKQWVQNNSNKKEIVNSLNDINQNSGTKKKRRIKTFISEFNPPPSFIDSFMIDKWKTAYELAKSYEDLNQKTLGSYSPTDRVIKLFKAKDKSTFLHESAHFFFDVYSQLAKENDAIKKDFDKLLSWVGAENAESVTRDQHEKFARGFEAFLLEGKVSSSFLKSAFNSFKVWLTNIYVNLTGLEQEAGFKLDLNDEIRGIMDRMLSSEKEIADATSEFANLTFGDKTIKDTLEESIIEAEATFTKRMISEMEKKNTSEYGKKFRDLTDTYRKQLANQPIYNVINVLQKGKTLSGEVLDIKLNTNSIVKAYGEETLRMLPRGSYSESGVDFYLVADQFGYANAKEFIEELINTPSLESHARQLANQQLSKENPELFKSVEIKAEALTAIHTEKRGQIHRLQYEYLFNKARGTFNKVARTLISRIPIDQQIKTQAMQTIGSLKTSEIKPYVFYRTEKKVSQLVAKYFTAGNFELALRYKKAEYLNHELYREASKAVVEMDKFDKLVKRVFEKDEDLAKKRDVDLVYVARAILAKYGIGKQDQETEKYLKQLSEYSPDAFNNLKEMIDSLSVDAGPVDQIDYDKFIELRDFVKTVWDLSKEQKLMEIDGKKVSIETARQEVIDGLVSFNDKAPQAQKLTLSDMDKFKTILLSAKASLRRVESLTDLFDMGNIDGPFRKYIFQPISDAATKYRLEKEKKLNEYKGILKKYEDIFKVDVKIPAENLGVEFTKTELLMALLHTGNKSNKSKLLRGRGWGTLNEDGSLNSERWDAFISSAQANGFLTEMDYKFAQEIWDLMESMKSPMQKAFKKMFGHYFAEITANEIDTPWGKFKGGYVPAKVDPYLSEDAAIRQEKNEFEQSNGVFSMPTTGRGMTKKRVESYAAPLDLNLDLLGSHIDAALRLTYIEPAIKDALKIVLNKEVRSVMSSVDKNLATDAIMPWLARTATQRVVTPSSSGVLKFTDKVATVLRKRVAMQVMTLNVANTLQQFTGVIVAASKVNPTKLKHASMEYTRNSKEIVEMIYEKSDWMRSSQGSNLYEASQAIEKMIVNKTNIDKAKDFADQHTYILQTGAQNIVNSIVWYASYNESIEKGLTESSAVKAADSAVRLTQGSMAAEDVSAFEVGSATQRLFTQFYGYFNMLMNLQTTEAQKIIKESGFKGGAPKLFGLYMTSMMLPAVISFMITDAMAGKFGDDDDDGYFDEFLETFLGSQFRTATAMVPWVGQSANVMVGAFNKIPYDDKLNLSPVLSVIENSSASPAKIYRGIEKGEFKKGAVKDFLTLVGVMSGLPIGPIGKPIGYLMDVESGKAKPTGPIDVTRGLISGSAGSK